jgi:hypothetical protein
MKDSDGVKLPGVVHHDVLGPSRGALLIAFVDRVRHDRSFGADFQLDPVLTAARLGLTLSGSEWSGLRDLLIR